jgi:type IV fimbrial biogenesis protein FimT
VADRKSGSSLPDPRGQRQLAQAGFTIVEIMVSVAILAVMMAVGIPAIGEWIQNRQVAAMAESIASGLRQGQSEAVQRNVTVDLVMTTASVSGVSNPSTVTLTAGGLTQSDTAPNWMLRVSGGTTAADFIMGKPAADGSPNARFSGPAGVSFSPLGRVSAQIAANGTATAPTGTLQFWVDNPLNQSTKRAKRCIYLSTGGSVRICDPRAVSPDARACTPACGIP